MGKLRFDCSIMLSSQVANARKLRDEAEARLAAAAAARASRSGRGAGAIPCLICYKKPELPTAAPSPGKQSACFTPSWGVSAQL